METARLILTEVSPDDAAFILELVNTPVWEEFLGDKKIKDLEAAARYIDKFIHDPDYRYWVVRLQEGIVPIGSVTLIQRDYLDHPDIGFAFLPAYLKKGYAYEAAAAVMNNQDVISGYPYILGTTHPGNQNSIRLLEKLGLNYQRVIHVAGNPLNLYQKTTGY